MAKADKDNAQVSLDAQTQATPPSPAKPTHIFMRRDPKEYPAPHRAHVHVDEVRNYAKGGWVPE